MTSKKIKILSLGIVVSLVFLGALYSLPSLKSNTSVGLEGQGTEDDPYRIDDLEELQMMSKELDAHYSLVDDVDAVETSGWNVDAGFEPIGDSEEPFTGSLDGRGHDIKGLYINQLDSEEHPLTSEDVGLFGRIGEGATVEDVHLSDVEIKGNDNVGGLAGYNDGGNIMNSTSEGSIKGEVVVGGLVGSNDEGVISRTGVEGEVEVEVEFGAETGGLVGLNQGGNIKQSFSHIDVEGENNVGGLVGTNRDGTIENSYSTGQVEGYNWVGRLIGFNEDGVVEKTYSISDVEIGWSGGGLIALDEGTLNDSFSRVDNEEDTGEVEKTSEEMKDVSTYTDLNTEGLEDPWDFIGSPNDDSEERGIWDIDESEEYNQGYPFLNWEEDLPEEDGYGTLSWIIIVLVLVLAISILLILYLQKGKKKEEKNIPPPPQNEKNRGRYSQAEQAPKNRDDEY